MLTEVLNVLIVVVIVGESGEATSIEIDCEGVVGKA